MVIEAYSATLTGAQLRGGGGLPCPFFEIQKSALILEKGPVGVHLWIKCSVQNVVLRVSMKKNRKYYPAWPCFLVFLTKCLSKRLSSTKPPLP